MRLRILLTVLVITIAGAALVPTAVKAGNPNSNGTQKQEAEQTENNQSRLSKANPAPQLNDSQERKNLIERLKRLNDGSKTGYVALVGPQGQLVAYYTIKGKVSSLNSLLTTPDQLVNRYGGLCDGDTTNCWVVNSPDLDGSYGKNPEGVFFFTTSGAMIEWTGTYLYSDQPLNYTTKPVIVENAN